jgi:hypothetical protein
VNYTPQEFGEITMRESFQRYQTSLDTISQELIKSPEKFKDKNKWRDFSEAFFTFMQNSKGQCDFPLSYILREHDYPDEVDPGNYATIEAYEEAIVPFSGAHYDVDKCMVFDYLKSYILGGPHWTWIQDFEQTRDGRSAWLALKEHFDGPGNKIRLKAAAYAAIKRAKYKGAKNFDYEFYRRIYTQAHSDLARYGEPVPETKKVKDFLDRITDSTLQPVKYTIAGFTHLRQNFHEAANYIGNIIDLNKKSEYSSRNISSPLAETAADGLEEQDVEEAGNVKVDVSIMEEAVVGDADEVEETQTTLGAGLALMNGAIWQKMKRRLYGMLEPTTRSAISARSTPKKMQMQQIMNHKDHHQNAQFPIPRMLGTT